jgi:two-component system nitrogen regulation response regulator NtrX
LAEARFFQVDDLKEAKLAFEKEFINLKLAQNRHNVTKTAETIGVGRSYLHKKIKNFK